MWLEGFQLALSGSNPLFLMLGTLVGLVVGVLPAIGPSFGVTLALPFTYNMDPATALIFLCAIQASCAYGDSIASILLNVPGGPGTVASCWEGYPMSQQGRSGTALGIATAASFAGGIIGWLSFVFLAQPMTAFALMIGPPEYFILGIMAMALISIASRGLPLRRPRATRAMVSAMAGTAPLRSLSAPPGTGIAANTYPPLAETGTETTPPRAMKRPRIAMDPSGRSTCMVAWNTEGIGTTAPPPVNFATSMIALTL